MTVALMGMATIVALGAVLAPGPAPRRASAAGEPSTARSRVGQQRRITLRRVRSHVEPGALAAWCDALARALRGGATLRHALSLYEQKKYPEAANVYASLVERFPNSQYAAAATLSAGNCFYLANMQKQAREWLGRVVKDGGDSAPEAAHWLARSYLKDREPQQALVPPG